MSCEVQYLCVSSVHTDGITSSFSVTFPKPYRNVVNMRLVHAVLPNSTYTIHEDDFQFLINDQLISIGVGYVCQIHDLISQVESQATDVKLCYDKTTGKLSFSSEGTLSVRFFDGSHLHKLFGFPSGLSEGTQVLVGLYPSTLLFYRSNLFKIRVPELSSVLLDDGTLDFIPRNHNDSITYYSNSGDKYDSRRFVHAVHLSQLHVEITDEGGAVVDMNGIDVVLVFQVYLLTQESLMNRAAD